ncbi:VanZ family protein [Demequina flava]|uniref:VanZ family protein n=1 Tax=Demequina flava TaxID=1095025 RepID=UPI000786106E|nr:VanZ family protein [Demequina flava]
MRSLIGANGAELFLLVAACALAMGVAAAFGHSRGKALRYALWAALITIVSGIAALTLLNPSAPGSTGMHLVNLTPFQEIERGLTHRGSSSWVNVVGNVAMFMPLGLVLACLIPGGFWRRLTLATAAGLAFTVIIECLQFGMGRVADIDDVILNTAGAFVGAFAGAAGATIAARLSRDA